ncbi:hypothetical protein [Kitasatospora sp. NPDC057936]|uniref:hypothetical protein n=1 Tax=Kitasatospora sp. NPDC057936 TaxID=3346283 RepID=UPI0036DF553F
MIFSMPSRSAHSCRVPEQAQMLSPMLGADAEPVAVAAVLQDTGYAASVVDTGQHMIDGAHYLSHLGVELAVCLLVAYRSSPDWEAAEPGLSAELTAFRREGAIMLRTPRRHLPPARVWCHQPVTSWPRSR